MDALIQQGAAVLASLRAMHSAENDMNYGLAGLVGALRVMMEFAASRIGDDNPVDPAMLEQLRGTLSNIEARIADVRALRRRRVCGVAVGRVWILGGALIGLGARRLTKQIGRLQADLAGDLAFLDLQMQANQARDLHRIAAGARFLGDDASAEARAFWAQAPFGRQPTADRREFARALARHLRADADADADADARCHYAAARLARDDDAVHARDFGAEAAGSIAAWVADAAAPAAGALGANAHGAGVTGMAAHLGHLVTASADGTAKVFHVLPNGAPLLKAALIGHADRVNDLACHGGRVATASDDRTARVWNMHDGSETAVVRHDRPVKAVFFAGPDLLVTATDEAVQNIRLFRIPIAADADAAADADPTSPPPRLARKLYGHVGGTTDIAVTAGGHVLTAGRDRSLQTWDLATGAAAHAVPRAHPAPVTAVRADGDLVATHADGAGTVALWSARDGGLRRLRDVTCGGAGDVGDMALVGDALLVASPGELVAVDARTGKVAARAPLRSDARPTAVCGMSAPCGGGGSGSSGCVAYVGYSDGSIDWLVDMRPLGTARAPTAAPPLPHHHLSAGDGGAPLAAAASEDTVLLGVRGSPRMRLLLPGGSEKAVALPSPAECVAPCAASGSPGFLVGTLRAVHRVDAAGDVVETMPLVGAGDAAFLAVRSVAEVAGRVFAQVFPQPGAIGGGMARIVRLRRGTGSEPLTTTLPLHVDPDAGAAANIAALGDDLLVHPRAEPGRVGLYDARRGVALPDIDFSARAPEALTAVRAPGAPVRAPGAPVRAPGTSEQELWTVHGGMDVLVWRRRKPRQGVGFEFVRSMAMHCEVADLMPLVGAGTFAVAFTDGTVAAYANANANASDKKAPVAVAVTASHRAGRVALAGGVSADARGAVHRLPVVVVEN